MKKKSHRKLTLNYRAARKPCQPYIIVYFRLLINEHHFRVRRASSYTKMMFIQIFTMCDSVTESVNWIQYTCFFVLLVPLVFSLFFAREWQDIYIIFRFFNLIFFLYCNKRKELRIEWYAFQYRSEKWQVFKKEKYYLFYCPMSNWKITRFFFIII